MKEEEQEAARLEAVFPCILRILPTCIFNKKDPIVLGVDVVDGIAKARPFCRSEIVHGCEACVLQDVPLCWVRHVVDGKVMYCIVNIDALMFMWFSRHPVVAGVEVAEGIAKARPFAAVT